jgi:hypothetical protein
MTENPAEGVPTPVPDPEPTPDPIPEPTPDPEPEPTPEPEAEQQDDVITTETVESTRVHHGPPQG